MLGGISDKEPACQCRRCKRQRFYSWVKKIPWRRAWQPTPVFVPENPMERGVWRATVCWVTKSWIWLKRLNTHTHSPWSMSYVCYYYYISMIPFCFYVAVYLCAFLMSEISFLFGLPGYFKTSVSFVFWMERECVCVCVCILKAYAELVNVFLLIYPHLRSAPSCIFIAIIPSII